MIRNDCITQGHPYVPACVRHVPQLVQKFQHLPETTKLPWMHSYLPMQAPSRSAGFEAQKDCDRRGWTHHQLVTEMALLDPELINLKPQTSHAYKILGWTTALNNFIFKYGLDCMCREWNIPYTAANAAAPLRATVFSSSVDNNSHGQYQTSAQDICIHPPPQLPSLAQ
jgi:hypothetical protein